MSGFWIFVIFATIIASVAKNNANAAKKAAKGDSTPSPEPQTIQDARELLEERIRELLKEQQTQQPAASQPQPSVATPAKQTTQASLQSSQSRKQKPYSQIKHNTITKKAAAQQSAPKVEELPNSGFEAIINDFSLEKAVIYSEILEPKFKQY